VQTAFVVIWVGLFVGSLIAYQVASPAFKRAAYVPFIVVVGILFAGFVTLLDGTRNVAFVVIVVAVITVINAVTVRFCPECGTYNHRPFSRPQYCTKCGAALDGDGGTRKDDGDLRHP